MKKIILLLLLAASPASAQVNQARMLSTPNAQTGTSYTFTAADTTRVTSFNNSSSVAVTLPNGATQGFGAGTVISATNLGTGLVTITCSSCTINGASTLALSQNQSADIYGGAGTPPVNYIAATAGVGAGTGDVTGPGSSTDSDVVVFNGTTGKAVKDPSVAVGNLPLLNANNAFTGANTLTGSLFGTFPGVFTTGAMHPNVSSLVNGIVPLTELGLGTGYVMSSAIEGGIAIPGGATIVNGNAIQGFANTSCNSSGGTVCNAAAGYFHARSLVTHGAVWGINPVSTDIVGTSADLVAGDETDVGVFGTPARVAGYALQLSGTGTMPTNSIAFEIHNYNGLVWNRGIEIDTDTASLGALVIDPAAFGNSVPSQNILLRGMDSAGVQQTTSIHGTALGGFEVNPSDGEFYLSGLHPLFHLFDTTAATGREYSIGSGVTAAGQFDIEDNGIGGGGGDGILATYDPTNHWQFIQPFSVGAVGKSNLFNASVLTANRTTTVPNANTVLPIPSTCSGSNVFNSLSAAGVFGCVAGGGGGSTPGGSTNSIQYNNAGALGGVGPGIVGQVPTFEGASAAPIAASGGQPPRQVSIATDTILCDSGTTVLDRGGWVWYTDATATTVTVPLPTSGCGNNMPVVIANDGSAGNATVNGASGVIFNYVGGNAGNSQDGQTSFSLPPGAFAFMTNDSASTWYVAIVSIPVAPIFQTNSVNNSDQTTLNLIPGSGITLTPSGGNITIAQTGSIANATTTVGTTTINANTCTSTTTVAMTGVTTSMTLSFTATTDVSGVTGWGSTGGLVLRPWPTAGNANLKVCNPTGSNITPSASVTFNISAR